MHRKIEELEKRWYRYKLKMLMIPLGSSIVTAFIGSGGYYLYDRHYIHNVPKTAVLSATKEFKEDAKKESIKVAKIEPKKIKKNSNDILLEPIIPVIDLEKEEAIRYPRRVSSKRKESYKHLVKAKRNDYLTARELASMSRVESATSSKPHVMKRIKLQSTSNNYIETMKEKFAHSHSFRDALLLAKAFYKKASYKEAEEWALKANKINSKLEDSWLIFAKSKAKMGKKQEAINILAKYYAKSRSLKAKDTIEEIRRGKI